MTRMAMEEEKEARFYIPVANISKRDYMGVYGVLAFIIGTVTYAAFFLGVMAVLFNTVITNIDEATVLFIGTVGLLGYLFYLFIYIFLSKRRAGKRYVRGKAALVQVIAQNIQHHVLAGDHKGPLACDGWGEQLAADLHAPDRLDALLMPRAGDIGIHVVLGKADLAPDLVGVDLPPADQFIDRGFAHVEDIRNLLRG